MSLISWSLSQDTEIENIQGICLDIDETLSTQGKLTAEAYSSLSLLKQSGFIVVPITGRPAGWCDHIARFWPVDAVIGENGAFVFYLNEKGVRSRLDTPGATEVARQKLKHLGQVILQHFPNVKWASDRDYREFDLAIDICEDVPTWPERDVEALLKLCKKEGAHAKLSSIHVNTWFGDYDKWKGFSYWLSQGAPGIYGKVPQLENFLFIGDSPNDEPLFEKFKCSVGVANLMQYKDRLKHPPRWITSQKSGSGFSEMAQRLVEVKLTQKSK